MNIEWEGFEYPGGSRSGSPRRTCVKCQRMKINHKRQWGETEMKLFEKVDSLINSFDGIEEV
jgi:hypothetical protein